MHRLVAIVVAITGHDSRYVIWKMPLRQVFVWEHVHLEKEGWTCWPPSVELSAEEVIRSFRKERA